jgi:hypothetical protein
MDQEKFVREGAAAIRPHLEKLVGLDNAAELDLRLSELLSAGPPEPLLAALKGSPATAQWWREFVQGRGVPPEEASVDDSGLIAVRGLPGLGQPVLDRYACPVDQDYVWYRRSPASAVPLCPTHRVQLRAQARDW